MWIKKITGGLYTYILVCITLAGISSLCIWYFSSTFLKAIELNRYKKTEVAQKLHLDELVKKSQNTIIAENLNAKQVLQNKILVSLENFDIFVISSDGEIISPKGGINLGENDFVKKGMYIYPTVFFDGSGFIIIKPVIAKMVSDVHEGLAVLLAIGAFIILTLLSIGKQLKYIKEIDSGIDVLAKGSLEYKLPIKGHNELAHLASSVNEMSHALQTKIEAEKEAEAKQRKLITNLSHDLRTPLTSVIGYLNLLCDKKYESEQEAEEYLHNAKEKSIRLQKLLHDLFAYTKLINGDIPYMPSKVNLHIFMLQYLETQELEVQMSSSEKELLVEVDIDWLCRIMDNLFDNIKKYANLDAPIKLILQKGENTIKLVLQNETIEDLSSKTEFLFDRMYVAKEERNNAASGLGLSIVSESMEKMGGKAYAKFSDYTLQIILEFPTEE